MRQFIIWTASELGLTLEFRGAGVHEEAVVVKIEGNNAPALKVGDVVMAVDPVYFRPSEVETLLGDPSLAADRLGWLPKISVREMCTEMTRYDLEQAKKITAFNAM